MFAITLPSGEQREVKISLFQALDGWDIQNKFIDFASTQDRALRREFTLEILSYAQVMVDGNGIPLSTDALIDNHLQTWTNVELVFNEVLMRNGINPQTHAEKPNYWTNAGAEMAIAFIAETTKLMAPALAAIDANMKAD